MTKMNIFLSPDISQAGFTLFCLQVHSSVSNPAPRTALMINMGLLLDKLPSKSLWVWVQPLPMPTSAAVLREELFSSYSKQAVEVLFSVKTEYKYFISMTSFSVTHLHSHALAVASTNSPCCPSLQVFMAMALCHFYMPKYTRNGLNNFSQGLKRFSYCQIPLCQTRIISAVLFPEWFSSWININDCKVCLWVRLKYKDQTELIYWSATS